MYQPQSSTRVLRLSIVALSMLTASTVFAAKGWGVEMADEVDIAGKKLVLNGLGLRAPTIFKIKVYVAGLYLTAKSDDPKAILAKDDPWRVEMRLLRNADRGRLVDAWTDGFADNSKAQGPALADRLKKLNSWMEDVPEGKAVLFTYEPGSGTLVEVSGKAKGVISGADFARALLACWLGDEPQDSDLKNGLIGK